MKKKNIKKNKFKKVSINKKTKTLKNKIDNNNKMLMSFDEYYEKNVSKEDKREIEFEVELIEKLIEARKSKIIIL